jgi:site-specific DNA-methyltransferase (adenine-specific)
MENYLSISQAAELLNVNPQTLRRWDKAGKFESLRHPINNYRVYKKNQIEKLFIELKKVKDLNNNKLKFEKSAFFETPFGKLYQLNAFDFLKSIPAESVHLIFADPPYNIKKAEWDSFESQKKYIDWSMEWIKEAERILHPTGSLYVCGFSEILADIKWAATGLFKGCKWLVWYYRNKANLGTDWGRSHESLLHFRKSKNFIFYIDNVRIPYNVHTLKYPKRTQASSSQYSNGKKGYIWEPNPNGAKPKDVLEIPTISNSSWEKTPHPTQKPVELVKKVIFASSDDNSIIVDPFGGSGTTFAVSEALKRRWIGSELKKDYCEIIRKRLLDKKHILRILSEIDEINTIKHRKKIRG